MGVLREKLGQDSPELYHALKRSWDIAWEEWLPALGTRGDSYNSFPHLRNLENYLDQVIQTLESASHSYFNVHLTPLETYMILAAVLFHDIGRIGGKENDHGKMSSQMICEHRAELGIPSGEIAHSLGKICHYHDVATKDRSELEGQLNDIVIDPYGTIRERLLASLLTLVDHLDSAFTRVLPTYLKNETELAPVGAFRRIIKGVYINHNSQMIRTVLGDPKKGKKRMPLPKYSRFINWKRFESDFAIPLTTLYTTPAFSNIRVQSGEPLVIIDLATGSPPSPDIIEHLSSALIEKLMQNVRLPREDSHLASAINRYWNRSTRASRAKVLERVVAKQQVFINKDCGSWHLQMLASMVMGNLRENVESLEQERTTLAAMGMPLHAWLIDYREHLYNYKGEETYEPIFHTDYLCSVANGMWRLSTEIFGSNTFSYNNLASTVREPDIERVKMAVRRIGIVTRDMCPQGIDQRTWRKGAIWVGDSGWKWNVQKIDGRCRFVSFDGSDDRVVKKKLEGLGNPVCVT